MWSIFGSVKHLIFASVLQVWHIFTSLTYFFHYGPFFASATQFSQCDPFLHVWPILPSVTDVLKCFLQVWFFLMWPIFQVWPIVLKCDQFYKHNPVFLRVTHVWKVWPIFSRFDPCFYVWWCDPLFQACPLIFTSVTHFSKYDPFLETWPNFFKCDPFSKCDLFF